MRSLENHPFHNEIKINQIRLLYETWEVKLILCKKSRFSFLVDSAIDVWMRPDMWIRGAKFMYLRGTHIQLHSH